MNTNKSPVRQLARDYYEGKLPDRDQYRLKRNQLIDDLLGESSPPPQPSQVTKKSQSTPIADSGTQTVKNDIKEPKSRPSLVGGLFLAVILLAAGLAYVLFRPSPPTPPVFSTTAQSVPQSNLEVAASPLLDGGWSENSAAGLISALTAASSTEIEDAETQRWYRKLKDLIRAQIEQDNALVIAGGFPSAREIFLISELGSLLGIEVPDWSAVTESADTGEGLVEEAELEDDLIETPPIEEVENKPAIVGEIPATKFVEMEPGQLEKSTPEKPENIAAKNSDPISAVPEVESALNAPSEKPKLAATSRSAEKTVAKKLPISKHECLKEKANTRKLACRDRLSSKANGPIMRIIQPGSFLMGSDAQPSEKPKKQVEIKYVFAMSTYEITQGEYSIFCRATGRACPANPWTKISPVVNVSWDDASAYSEWLSTHTGKNYRLPSEAEWEYAARAGTTSIYPFGNELLVTRARFSTADNPLDSPVDLSHKQINANAFKLFHMVGNVSEWVADTWSDTLPSGLTNGQPHLTGDKNYHVIRGGSYADGANELRSSYRAKMATQDKNKQTGFRVVLAFD